MNFQQILMAAATQGGGAAAAVELFPDPTLSHVTDATNGWTFSAGFPTYGPAGGTGPGIALASAAEDDSGSLAGTDKTAFRAAVANGSTKTVMLTCSAFVADGTVIISIKDGTLVEFVIEGLGTLSHSVTAGSGVSGFDMYAGADAPAFTISAISVT